MAGWVVESGYRYAKAAALLTEHGLGQESEVVAALAVELLLKSLLATPVEGSQKVAPAQPYSTQRGHDLLALYKKIPKETADKLKLSRFESTFKTKKDTFLTARYPYEEKAPAGYDSCLLYTAADLIPAIVDFFIEQGSTDPWIISYKKDRDRFKLPNGIKILGVFKSSDT